MPATDRELFNALVLSSWETALREVLNKEKTELDPEAKTAKKAISPCVLIANVLVAPTRRNKGT